MSREILEAMNALAAREGHRAREAHDALEDALLSAYKKQPGAAKYARVELDHETGDFRVFELIIPERPRGAADRRDDRRGHAPSTPRRARCVEPQDPEIDPEKFEEYRDQIDERDVTPDDFGRIAAQTAKQVILQRIREAERDMMFEEYRDRVGELITGIVQQKDSRYTLIQLRERVEALLPKCEQVEGERYEHNQRIKAVIKEVSASTKGPSIIVSRRDPELIKSLFELEVPEIADGLVEIANVAREPGYRSKIAVVSHADGVDPVGACVGPRGSRVRMVVSELRGEKIDIIPYNDEPARFVAKALSPARVREVLVDDEARQATVVVPDDQLSLAIGREGQNARLAARLTGWRIDIRSETEFATEESEGGYEEEETQRPLRRDPRHRPPLPERRAARLALLRPRQPTRRSPTSRRDYVTGAPPEPEDLEVDPEARASSSRRRASPRRPSPRRLPRRSPKRSSPTTTPSSPTRRPPSPTASRAGRRRRGARVLAAQRVPERRCIGCGATRPKPDLRRLALDGERVVADPARPVPAAAPTSAMLHARGAHWTAAPSRAPSGVPCRSLTTS